MGGGRKLGIAALLVFLSMVVPARSGPALTLQKIGSGFSQPLFVCAPPGSTGRLFVVEQASGLIKILNLSNSTVNASPFLRVTGLTTGGEQGLLGMAFHPNYTSNGFFYVNYTTTGLGAAGHTEVSRFTVSSDPNVADAASKKVILSFAQPEANHNGGWIGFGKDGWLYVGSGDGGGGDDRHGTIGNAQDVTSLLGKILRIDVDGADPYAIPNGNPFKGDSTKKQEIWAFGLRNPWRCSFDRQTGDLWIGDVGQNTREEVDFIPAGVGGLNFGWRPREGLIQNPDYTGSPYAVENPVTPATNPLLDYGRSLGVSVIGGYCYRGKDIAGLEGTYFFGDYGSGRIWSCERSGVAVSNLLERTAELNPGPARPVGSLSSFGEDARGELYVCDLADGEIYKLVSAQPRISQVTSDGTRISFSFEALAGRSYAVETSLSMTNGSWQVFSNYSATGEVTNRQATDLLPGPRRFYRIRTP